MANKIICSDCIDYKKCEKCGGQIEPFQEWRNGGKLIKKWVNDFATCCNSCRENDPINYTSEPIEDYEIDLFIKLFKEKHSIKEIAEITERSPIIISKFIRAAGLKVKYSKKVNKEDKKLIKKLMKTKSASEVAGITGFSVTTVYHHSRG